MPVCWLMTIFKRPSKDTMQLGPARNPVNSLQENQHRRHWLHQPIFTLS